ncbi:MAG: chromosome segregation protein SMC [Chitinophagaceae bacterium]|nr:chromosome segregation protein SMC [Chitinophagaceae bacterium]
MKLKSLEIKGFKSFADKTVLNFDDGVTGVIGPNGCGKSNIIDSIRWVIGEQKISQLRSENLESLIFNGSKTRNPSGLAEVSLTFENTKNLLPTEFNTITVTRKYYRNGDSEYRLNDVACRLKDIHNLFLDTGVSTDSYAIIELGMVDDIIKDKDNSRRRMLEQAAGITIYKTRKREAKLKLDATEHDLARIEDLLFEINNQLKTLENQAKKAEKYLEIKKDYKEISIELAKAALEGFALTLNELTERQNTESDRKTEAEAAIAKAEAEVEKDKVTFIEKEAELQTLQHQFNEIVNELRDKKGEEDLGRQKLGHLQEKRQNLEGFIEKAKTQIEGIGESIVFTESQISDEENNLKEQSDKLNELKELVEAKRTVYDEKRKSVDNLRQMQLQIQKNRFEAEKNVAVADTSITNIRRTLTLLKEEQEQRVKNLETLRKDKEDKETSLTKKQEEWNSLNSENERIKSEILSSQESIEQLRNQLIGENRILDSKQNEYDLLKNLIDKMEGYPESVKYLHNRAEWMKEAPLLSDIMYVKEEYRAAVENILEPYLNYYVVPDEETALRSIRLLENDKKGKAKFFILNRLLSAGDTAPRPQGNVIAALDVVEVDAKYRELAKHLLGNVFIAEDEASFHSAKGIILEKNGRMVKGDYSLSGGSVGLFEGKKIGRVKNLEKIAADIEIQKGKTSSLKAEIEKLSSQILNLNVSLKEQQLSTLQREINELTNSLNAVTNKIETLDHQEQGAVARIDELEKQLSATLSGISDTRGLLAQLTEKADDHDAVLKEASENFAKAEEDFNTHNSKYYEANLQLNRQQSKIQGIKQELAFKQTQVTNLQKQRDDSESQLTEAAAEIEKTTLALDRLKATITEKMRVKEEEEKKLNDADTKFHIFRNELTEKENALRQLQKAKEQADLAVFEIKDRLNNLNLEVTGMRERLMVEFRIDLDDILKEERNTSITEEELQEKRDRLKKRLENIGEVNPMAVEAFAEMKKRYDFINEQKNDLVEARTSLKQTIEEVEAAANQKFLETFNQVRENFTKVFKALFTDDDSADMVLIDPDNLAETGIDVIAKPKGKRPTSITQLSGGEKTLTATALLFSIYLIKPAPFCILDEVDAPLDDANVQKFTQMIRKFSKDSQFIIVTHNKMTMAAVDVIYGVTMQEAGVSKLVPVDFRGLEHEYEMVEETVAP